MKLFLTLAVYSVRIQAAFPTQATVTPLLVVYFTITILLAFLASIYFVVKDYLDNRADLPDWLLKTGVYVMEKLYKKGSEEEVEMSEKTCLGSKCNKCALCSDCQEEKQKEKDKQNKKDQNIKILSGLNWLVFIVFLMIYVISFIVTWGLIITP